MASNSSSEAILQQIQDRAPYIPLRLNERERALLSVCNGALDVSEYTDKVDVSRNDYYVSTSYNKTDTVVKEIKYLCGVMVGLRAGCALKNRA